VVYIDLNMIRAGVVSHPGEWAHSGYRDIQEPPERYSVIDLQGLTALCGFADLGDFQRAHRQWVERALENGWALRDDRWSKAIAVGSLTFVENVKSELGIKAMHREVEDGGATYALRERSEAYGGDLGSETDALRRENTISWDENAEAPKT
jgi:putative transposase